MPVTRSDRAHTHRTSRWPLLPSLLLFAVCLASGPSPDVLLSGFMASGAQAATGVTTAPGTVPAAAGTVFGSWDAILTSNIIPLGALAVGLAAIFGGIRAGSGGLIGGGIIGVLAAILTVALPAIVTEGAAGAGFDGWVSTQGGVLLPITPLTPVVYMVVGYVRRAP